MTVGTQQHGQQEQFFITFNRLVQMSKIHQDNNQILIDCSESFMTLLLQLSEEEPQVTVQIVNGRFFVQGQKLIYQRETAELIQHMLQFFQERGLEGIRFKTGQENRPHSSTDVIAFIRLLNAAGKRDHPLEWLGAEMERGGYPWAEVVKKAEAEIEHHEPLSEQEQRVRRQKKRARRTYACALSSIRNVAERVSVKQPVGSRKAVRIVQNMVDIIMGDEPVLLGLSTIRDFDDYTFSHSVNVAVLSMYLGKRIGLSRSSLERLGICGLFHDLGKVDISLDILHKPGRLTEEEIEEVQKHPLNTVRQVMKLKASRALKSRIIIPPFEHHMRYDLSGYPRVHRHGSISFFGNILAIADAFDAMTTPRPYQEPYSPDRALVLMLHGSGRYFHPVLLKVFIGMVGLYPVGTLLELDSGELGLVMEPPEQSDGSLPRILLLEHDGQGGFGRGSVVDLSETDPKTGAPLRKIVKSMHPSTRGIQPAEYFLA